MRLDEYCIEQTLTEGRTQKIGEQQTLILLKKHCMKSVRQWQKKGKYIYRGIDEFWHDYGVVVPKKSERTSRNTSNYYTLFFDNSKKWKAFPKRSQSIIASTTEQHDYGVLYDIFPYDGAKIGVVPSEDMWFGFNFMIHGGLNEYNRVIEAILNIPNKFMTKKSQQEFDGSWSEMRKAMDKFDDWYTLAVDETIENWKEDAEPGEVIGGKFEAGESIKEIMEEPLQDMYAPVQMTRPFFEKYNGDMQETLDYFLDPKKSSFKIIKAGDPLPAREHEVWTDGKSIAIMHDKINSKYTEMYKWIMEL